MMMILILMKIIEMTKIMIETLQKKIDEMMKKNLFRTIINKK